MTPPRPETRGNRNSAPAPRARAADDRAGAPKALGQPNMPPRKAWLTFAIILLLNYVLMSLLFPTQDTSVTVPYTIFKEEVAKGNVKSIYSMGPSIEGRFAKPVTWPPPNDAKTAPANVGEAGERQGLLARFLPKPEARMAETFTTTLPAFVDPGLEAFLIDAQRGDQRRADQVRQRTSCRRCSTASARRS